MLVILMLEQRVVECRGRGCCPQPDQNASRKGTWGMSGA
jgi:hypothetical protein